MGKKAKKNIKNELTKDIKKEDRESEPSRIQLNLNKRSLEGRKKQLVELEEQLVVIESELLLHFNNINQDLKKTVLIYFGWGISAVSTIVLNFGGVMIINYGIIENHESLEEYVDEKHQNIGYLGAGLLLMSLSIPLFFISQELRKKIEKKREKFKIIKPKIKSLNKNSETFKKEIKAIEDEIKILQEKITQQETAEQNKETENQEKVERKTPWSTILKEDYNERLAANYFSEKAPELKHLPSNYDPLEPIKFLHEKLKINDSFDDFKKWIQIEKTITTLTTTKTLYEKQNFYNNTRDFLKETLPILKDIADNVSLSYDDALKEAYNKMDGFQFTEPLLTWTHRQKVKSKKLFF